MVSPEQAVGALRRQREALEAIDRACRDARIWDEAWHSASG
jgi:hypothetical protein